MFKTIFVHKRFGVCEFTVPEDLQSEFDALSPRMKYLATNGWSQGILDSYAGAQNAAEFEGKARAKYDAILAGTVKSPGTGTGRASAKSALEKEIIRLATNIIDGALAKKPTKTHKDDRLAYIAKYVDAHPELREEAEFNLEKIAEDVESSGDILADLLAGVAPDPSGE